MPAKKRGKKVGNTPRGFLPPDDPVYSAGLIVAGILVEKRREKEGKSLEPKRGSDFLNAGDTKQKKQEKPGTRRVTR